MGGQAIVQHLAPACAPITRGLAARRKDQQP